DDAVYQKLCYRFCASMAIGSSARPLSEVSVSTIGNPEDTIVVDGRTLTRLALRYYGRYAYVGRHLDWNQVQVVAELGSGAGGQTEVLAKLHPELTLLLFDIPPQLYICEQYLKAVFGDRVISYRQARTLLPDSKPTKGKIHVLGNWMLDR